MKYKFCSLF